MATAKLSDTIRSLSHGNDNAQPVQCSLDVKDDATVVGYVGGDVGKTVTFTTGRTGSEAVRSKNWTSVNQELNQKMNRVFAMLSGASTNQKRALLLDLIGCRIDNRYAITELLGLGGSGVVFKCSDSFISREVAVKLLLTQDPEDCSDFLREATVSSVLGSCREVMTVFHFGATETGMLFQIMELLKGESLHDLIQRLPDRRLSKVETALVGITICNGLTAAHRLDIIHRDIKPQNIFIPHGCLFAVRAKLLDWGTAYWDPKQVLSRVGCESTSVDGDGSRELDATIASIGTLRYMSPEQYRHVLDRKEPLDGRADIYSLAVTLFQCVNGCLPTVSQTFNALQRSFQQFLVTPSEDHKETAQADLKLFEAEPVLREPTDELSLVIARAAQKCASDRYGTTSQFKEALEFCLSVEKTDGDLWNLLDQLIDDRISQINIAPYVSSDEQLQAVMLGLEFGKSVRSVEGPGWVLLRSSLNQVMVDLRDENLDWTAAWTLATWIRSDFSSTESIDIRGNPLGTAGLCRLMPSLTSLKQLKSLCVGKNQFDPEAIDELCSLLSQCSSLRCFTFEGEEITSSSLNRLLETVSTAKFIRELELRDLGLRSVHPKTIAELLGPSSSIIVLDLTGNRLDTESIQHICNQLASNRTVIELKIGENQIDFMGSNGSCLTRLLDSTQTLTTLNISGNLYDSESVSQICSAFTSNTTVTSLSWSGYDATFGMLLELSEMIRKHPRIHSMDLPRCVSDEDLSLYPFLLSAVSVNQVLCELSLVSLTPVDSDMFVDCSALGDLLLNSNCLKSLVIRDTSMIGISHLVPGFARSSSLNRLELVHVSCLTDETAASIISALAENDKCQITFLNLSSNQLDINSASALACLMQITESLTELILDNNILGAHGLHELLGSLHTNSTLKRLSLSNNGVLWERMEVKVQGRDLAQKAIRDDSVLRAKTIDFDRSQKSTSYVNTGESTELIWDMNTETLHLKQKHISMDGFIAVANCLAANSTLSDLNLSSNMVGPMAIGHFCEQLAANSSLTQLNLSNNELDDSAVARFTSSLIANKSLQELNLTRNQIKLPGLRKLLGVTRFRTLVIRLSVPTTTFEAPQGVVTQKYFHRFGNGIHMESNFVNLKAIQAARRGTAAQGVTVSGQPLKADTGCTCSSCVSLREQPLSGNSGQSNGLAMSVRPIG
eukprot:GILJ01012805.1.p1 GENE.GILJ01012805.1~~GILJ01012805.1.p1  ORF type:complete len:1310 (-),score=206.08 GILJ01012805.1:115-3660(-)